MWGEKPYRSHFRGRQDLNVAAKTSVFSLFLSADHSTLNSSSGLDNDGAAAVGPRRHSSDNELSVAQKKEGLARKHFGNDSSLTYVARHW
jgi:hypothetical protein